MQNYANRGGDSGVIGYEIGNDRISVTFRGGATYLYTYKSTGEADIEEMKSLAQAGQGLNSFISRHVRKRFAQKL